MYLLPAPGVVGVMAHHIDNLILAVVPYGSVDTLESRIVGLYRGQDHVGIRSERVDSHLRIPLTLGHVAVDDNIPCRGSNR